MHKSLRKSHALLTPANFSLVDLPAPKNLSLMWNFGSLLGICLMIQIITGMLLSMHYSPHTNLAFMSITHIVREVNCGWILRNMHANGASMFFICLYLHMSRSLYFGSFKMSETWNIGVVIFILSMATAFMGYLLPWGQMSFWGATVITNLFSAIPYMGPPMVEWLWGGFGVNTATLNRFFSLHFVLPIFMVALVILHLIFLHSSGSNNPLGLMSNGMKAPFHTHYSAKDALGFLVLFVSLIVISFLYPNLLSDPENFAPANPLITPTHIKPEWYFLWAYAILRSIPNKLGGVIIMFSAILVLFLPSLSSPLPQSATSYCSMKQFFTWSLITVMVLLTWIGGSPVEAPFDSVGAILTMLYFLLFLSIYVVK